jgi:hypothetical protein
VPLVKGYAEGREVLFQHTEVSDPKVAERLTDTMKSPVLVVPSLAQAPEALVARVWVFTNGVRGEGPFNYQPDVFDHLPPAARDPPRQMDGRAGGAPAHVGERGGGRRAGGVHHDRAARRGRQHAAGHVAGRPAVGRVHRARLRRLRGALGTAAGALVWWSLAAADAASLTTETGGVRVEVGSVPQQPVRHRRATYTVRLTRIGGAPVTDARVTLTGRMADGMSVAAALRPSSEPGIYRGDALFTMEGRWDLTIRVVREDGRFEVSLTETVGR